MGNTHSSGEKPRRERRGSLTRRKPTTFSSSLQSINSNIRPRSNSLRKYQTFTTTDSQERSTNFAMKRNSIKGIMDVTVEYKRNLYHLHVQSQTKVHHIKAMLNAQHAIDVTEKQLAYGVNVLEDDKTLQDYSYKPGDRILLRDSEADKSPLSQLLRAADVGDMETLTSILATGIDVNELGRTGKYKGRKALSLAAEGGHNDVVKLLRGVGAAVNAKDENGLTPLLVAAVGGHANICQLLLQQGADIDVIAQGMKLIHHAASGGHVHVLEFLRDICNIHELTEEELSPLHFSAQNDNLEATLWLVEMGINFNIRDKRGCTAEDYARDRGHKEIETYLYQWALLQQKKFLQDARSGNLASILSFFKIGIDVECKSQIVGDWGQRAIHIASMAGHTEVVNNLLFAGARRQAKDDMGNTAMHYAASGGQIAVMKLLKNESCKVNVCNNYNMTPLHFSAKNGQLAAVSWLLAQGVQADIVSNDGLTAIDMAKKEKHRALVDVLQKHLGTMKKETTADVIKIGRKLGEGTFGEAFLATMNNREIVVKKIKITERNKTEIDFSENELLVLKTLKHPNIVTYMGDRRTKSCLYILMEYCNGGDLNQRILQQRAEGKPFEEKLVLSWTSRIASALTYIHGQNILHRDLKPHNIFLSDSGAIKLGDFGLAKIMDESKFAQSFVGAPAYMSPEVLGNIRYNDKADMWSFGCILYELAALKMGFPYVNVTVPGNFCKNFKTLVKDMLNVDPDKRPSASEVWRLSFLKPEPKSEQLQPRQRQLRPRNREQETSLALVTDLLDTL